MKTITRLLFGILALAVVLPMGADAQVILREKIYDGGGNGVQIPNGVNTLPDADGIGIPKRSANAHVSMTAANWVNGTIIGIQITRDFHNWEWCYGPQAFNKPALDKAGVQPPVAIGCGWNPDRDPNNQPVAGRLYVDNEGAQFRSTVDVIFTD
jgi:hypothetical protein